MREGKPWEELRESKIENKEREEIDKHGGKEIQEKIATIKI